MLDISVSSVGCLLRLCVSIAFLCLSLHYYSNLNGSQDCFALFNMLRPNGLHTHVVCVDTGNLEKACIIATAMSECNV